MISPTLLAMARRQIETHPMARAVGEIETLDGRVSVSFDLDLDFGARWIAEGASPTGVRPVERVRFDFPDDYPARAPQPSYRPELGRAFAHVQPWLTPDGRPVPCLTAMAADEFVSANGLTAYVDQFWLWLRGAAGGHLITPEQGWEPSRRDDLEDDIIVDRGALRALADDPGLRPDGYAWLRTIYVARGVGADDPGQWFGEIRGVANLARGYGVEDLGEGYVGGQGFGLALWATSSEGPAPVFDQYEAVLVGGCAIWVWLVTLGFVLDASRAYAVRLLAASETLTAAADRTSKKKK